MAPTASPRRRGPGRKGTTNGRDRAAADPTLPAADEVAALHRAAARCNAAFVHVAGRSRSVKDPEDLVYLVDAAELCCVTAAFVARDAHYAGLLRDVCSQQCHDAAQKCLRRDGHPVLQACAQALHEAQQALDAAAQRHVD